MEKKMFVKINGTLISVNDVVMVNYINRETCEVFFRSFGSGVTVNCNGDELMELIRENAIDLNTVKEFTKELAGDLMGSMMESLNDLQS